jgi:hypothetical protein
LVVLARLGRMGCHRTDARTCLRFDRRAGLGPDRPVLSEQGPNLGSTPVCHSPAAPAANRGCRSHEGTFLCHTGYVYDNDPARIRVFGGGPPGRDRRHVRCGGTGRRRLRDRPRFDAPLSHSPDHADGRGTDPDCPRSPSLGERHHAPIDRVDVARLAAGLRRLLVRSPRCPPRGSKKARKRVPP